MEEENFKFRLIKDGKEGTVSLNMQGLSWISDDKTEQIMIPLKFLFSNITYSKNLVEFRLPLNEEEKRKGNEIKFVFLDTANATAEQNRQLFFHGCLKPFFEALKKKEEVQIKRENQVAGGEKKKQEVWKGKEEMETSSPPQRVYFREFEEAGRKMRHYKLEGQVSKVTLLSISEPSLVTNSPKENGLYQMINLQREYTVFQVTSTCTLKSGEEVECKVCHRHSDFENLNKVLSEMAAKKRSNVRLPPFIKVHNEYAGSRQIRLDNYMKELVSSNVMANSDLKPIVLEFVLKGEVKDNPFPSFYSKVPFTQFSLEKDGRPQSEYKRENYVGQLQN